MSEVSFIEKEVPIYNDRFRFKKNHLQIPDNTKAHK